MAKMYDISAKITNELPTLKITEDIIVTINNRKNNVLSVQAMLKEREQNKTDEETDTARQLENVKRGLELLVGVKNAKAIEQLDLPINEYTTIFQTVTKIAQGLDPDEPDTP